MLIILNIVPTKKYESSYSVYDLKLKFLSNFYDWICYCYDFLKTHFLVAISIYLGNCHKSQFFSILTHIVGTEDNDTRNKR
jgi:hypothetical protein